MSREEASGPALVPLCFDLPSLLHAVSSYVSGLHFPKIVSHLLYDFFSTSRFLHFLNFSSSLRKINITYLKPTLQKFLSDPITSSGLNHHPNAKSSEDQWSMGSWNLPGTTDPSTCFHQSKELGDQILRISKVTSYSI